MKNYIKRAIHAFRMIFSKSHRDKYNMWQDKHEDLASLIYKITPVDTPFGSAIKKDKKPVEWQSTRTVYSVSEAISLNKGNANAKSGDGSS